MENVKVIFVMDFRKLKVGTTNRLMKALYKNKGWKTSRKIIVIESDDWGSIRMPDLATYQRLLDSGIRVDKSPYNRYDTLASIEDFEALFKILKKHRDKNGNHPIITANTIVANPDFEKILASNFEEYHYEVFTETLKKYPGRSFDCWKYGMSEGLFYPQLHGREHLNVNKWLHYLQNGNKDVLFAFQNNFFAIGNGLSKTNISIVLEAFQINEHTTISEVDNILSDAARIFNNVFGYQSKSFIAPNYTWNKKNEKVMANLGIKFIQGSIIQRDIVDGNYYNYLGKINKHNQIYLVRNLLFEPSAQKTEAIKIVKDIEAIFNKNMPVIISSHRLNFTGSLVKENRIQNLLLLDQILREVIKKWEVEFMTSNQLGELISKDYSI